MEGHRLAVQRDQEIDLLCGRLDDVRTHTDLEGVVPSADSRLVALGDDDPVSLADKDLREKLTDRHESLARLSAYHDIDRSIVSHEPPDSFPKAGPPTEGIVRR